MRLSHVPLRKDGDDIVVPLRVRRANLGALLAGVAVVDVWLTPQNDGTYGLMLGVDEISLPEPINPVQYCPGTGEVLPASR